MFRPNWPSSGVQVVVVKDSAPHCNAVFFPPVVVSCGYFGETDGNPHNQNNRVGYGTALICTYSVSVM
jgi:hypothetical protein